MKTIVSNPGTEIKINDLTGKEIVGYYSRGEHLCLLHRTTKNKYGNGKAYAFFNMAYSDADPSFLSETFFESIRDAMSAGRIVFAFDSYADLIKHIKERIL